MSTSISSDSEKTLSPKPASLWRSIVAVLAGLATTAVTSVVIDSVLAATGVYPPMGESWSDGLYVWALSFRVPLEVVGGYVTAKLSPRNPMAHVLALAGLVAVGTFFSAISLHADSPVWYRLGLIAIALPCSLLGERLRRLSRN